jgi:hypothetical protein
VATAAHKDNGTGPPQTQADSTAVTANAVGTWCFRAVYTPGGANGANYLTSNDSTNDECFLVQDSTSASSLQSWVPSDTATVAATGGTALNGTLTVTLHESSNCSGPTVTGQTYTKTLTAATTAADRTLTTTNSSYVVTTPGKIVSWDVLFTPTAGSNVTGSEHCETSTVTITN